MWQLDVSQITDNSQTPARHRLEVGSVGQTGKLVLQAEHELSVAENEHYLVCVLGRLRPYNQDYGLPQPAEWLLECLEQKGEGFYHAIAGFFAFALMDKQSGELRLVSDHIGTIPLYFYARGEQWWVADSLKLLEPHIPQEALGLHPQAVYNYCFYHFIPSPEAIYEGVLKVQPGAQLRVDARGRPRSESLYQPDYRYRDESPETLMARCREVIDEAVRRNIVPRAGAFLSGGLDSSTVAGMFARHQPGASTFSIGFDASGYDETEYARITARQFKTDHHEHYLQPREIADNFVEVAGYFDEPFGNSSAMAAYICARQASEQGIEVMLAGDGGDEIFGGNERYAKQKLFEAWSRVPAPVARPLAALLGTPVGALPVLKKARSYIEQAATPLPDRMDSYNFLNRFAPETVFEEDFLARISTEAPWQAKRERYRQCPSTDPVERMMYLDWKFTLADNDLVKVSRMCRKAGVEVRYPLLEKEVVDFACTVPPGIKLPGGRLRDFYKKSFRGFLADETLAKSKHGFGLPFGVWMKEHPELKKLTREALEGLKGRRIFRPDFIDTALHTYQNGHAGYYGELIWVMLVLELWLTGRGR